MTEKKQFNNKEPKKQSFAGLAEELSRWYGEETFPANVSGDAAYILQAQRQRLRKKGLEMEYAMTSQDFFDEKKNGKVNMLFLRWKCEGDIIFTMDTGKKKKLSRSLRLCGAADWLGRRYMVEQLYWKTEQGTNRKKILRRVAWCFGIGAVIGFLVALYQILIQDSMVYANLLINPVIGALFSYAAYALVQLGKLLVKSIRMMPLIRRNNQTAMEITSIMQLLNQDFSFPLFEAQMVNLLQKVIYTGDISELSQYEPEARERCLEDIVHCVYDGNMIYRGYRKEGEKCILHIDIYMNDIYEKNARIRSRRDLFHMTVCRDLGNHKEKGKNWSVQAMWRQ
ncbi:hypothetical protein [Jutongia sp.]|uniref:hypothetical protein n=1 Tax=Jutongia sp. TaxID=2944204 RepID=UPI0030801EF9